MQSAYKFHNLTKPFKGQGLLDELLVALYGGFDFLSKRQGLGSTSLIDLGSNTCLTTQSVFDIMFHAGWTNDQDSLLAFVLSLLSSILLDQPGLRFMTIKNCLRSDVWPMLFLSFATTTWDESSGLRSKTG